MEGVGKQAREIRAVFIAYFIAYLTHGIIRDTKQFLSSGQLFISDVASWGLVEMLLESSFKGRQTLAGQHGELLKG